MNCVLLLELEHSLDYSNLSTVTHETGNSRSLELIAPAPPAPQKGKKKIKFLKKNSLQKRKRNEVLFIMKTSYICNVQELGYCTYLDL